MDYKLDRLEKAANIEKRGNWEEMLKFCEKWTVDEPSNYLAWQGIGDALKNLGMLNEAIPMYNKGLEVAPDHPVDFLGVKYSSGSLWYRLGHTYNKLGDSDKAINALKKAVLIDPEEADIWNDLGIIFISANKPKDALEAFKSGLAVSPNNILLLTNLGILFARCNLEENVMAAYQMLNKLDSRAATTFLANAKQILSS